MKQYKRLFNIKYNNKLFTIFLDEKKRRAFLELRKNGEYHYPSLEDFLYLNKIYNTTSHIDKVPMFTFNEKVRMKAGFLTVVSLVSLGGCTNTKVEVKDDELIITEAPTDSVNGHYDYEKNEYEVATKIIKNIAELDSILGYDSVSIDQVRRAIDENDNLPEKVKKAAHEALNDMLKRYPKIDLRIFYNNVLELTYEEIPREELQKEELVEATFDPKLKKITTHPDVREETLKHEINHTFYSFYIYYDSTVYVRDTFGHSLTEAMTESMTTRKVESGVYQEERYFLDYLSSLVDFSIEDYYEKGIWDLISKLEAKFPSVDIDYIVCSLDSRKESRLNKDTIEIICEPIEIIEELYSTCLETIDTNNPYKNFAEFAHLIEKTCSKDVMFEYLDCYNVHLQNLGSENIISKETFQEYYRKFEDVFILAIKGREPIAVSKTEVLVWEDNSFVFSYVAVDGSGNEEKKEITLNSYDEKSTIWLENGNLWSYLFKYADYLGKDSFWPTVIQTEKLVSPHEYQKIPIYFYEELVTTDYVNELDIHVSIGTNGEIGFGILKNGETIFTTSEYCQNTTNSVPLNCYLPFDLDYITRLELEQILNYEYLKEKEGPYSHWFYNLSMEDDKFVIIPEYKVRVKVSENEEITTELRMCYLHGYSSFDNLIDANLYCGNFPIDSFYLDASMLPNSTVHLEEILKEKGILNPNIIEYTFTQEELENLFLSYLEENVKKKPHNISK